MHSSHKESGFNQYRKYITKKSRWMAKVQPTMLLLLGSMLSVGPASPLGMSPSSGGEVEAGKVLHPQEWCLGSEQWNTAEMSEILLNLSQTSLLKQRFVNTWASPTSPLPPDPLPSPLPPSARPHFLPPPHFSTAFLLPLFTFLTTVWPECCFCAHRYPSRGSTVGSVFV